MTSPTEREFAEFDSNSVWNEVYQRLKNEASLTTLGDEFSTKLARDPDNRRKNRYRDVSPYDHSRVVLSGDNNYINASLLKVPDASRQYILTQGPLEHTMCDFWQMTWEQNTKAVVMLNRVIEKGALKCAQYWPLGSNYGYEDEMYFPECGLRVTLITEQDFQHFSLRSLELEHMESGEKREVLHFHYTTWPDFGVPSSPDAFLHFLHSVRQTNSLAPDVGPAIVHCSAGIGRSGTFCLVDSCLVMVEKEGTMDNINVRESLIRMRSFRMGLIQTADQLRFSYLAIIQGAQAILKGSGLESLQTQNCSEGVPPPPPQRTSSLQPPAKPKTMPSALQLLSALDENEDPPALPPKKNSPLQRQSGFSGWDGEMATDDDLTDDDEDDEEFDKLIDRDEDKENIGDNVIAADSDSESDSEMQRAQVRQRIREQRKQETMQKIKEMKDKQRRSERWRPYKSFFTPSVYFGIAVLVGIAGVVVYRYML
ncbi:tyrosine-protein phosphatase non-receptor type 2 [Aplysia californica]|uniref:protein-tyrosine-phosphatase n=1 Tax=Aplysia californica TaxID=6500 RepID=A0ABM0JGL7_APLCA|nr:tyrosine-protein phosphatase non-receptor type 2 [Aplysia californica]